MDREKVVRAIRRRCRGPRSAAGDTAVKELLERGDTERAAIVDRRTRTRCGYDVNELILAEPLDGQERTAKCPQCGTPITWVAADLGEK